MVEEILGYHFKNREILFVALTSKSYAGFFNSKNQCVGFQRLEFLVDAIAKFAVVSYLYGQFPEMKEGAPPALKVTCITNETMARLAVKKRLDPYYYVKSDPLTAEIKQFKNALNPKNASTKRNVEVRAPKPFADLFEACLGAVYVDSGLEDAFKVAIRLLDETIRNESRS